MAPATSSISRRAALGIAAYVILLPIACGHDEPIRSAAPMAGFGLRDPGGAAGFRCYAGQAGAAGHAGQPSPPGGAAGALGLGGSEIAGTGGSGGEQGAGGEAGGGAGADGSGTDASGGAPPGPVCSDGGPAPAAGGMPADAFSFFVFGDSRTYLATFERSVYNMVALDPAAVAAFTAGDLTDTGTAADWDAHQAALACGAPDPCVPNDPLGIVRQSRFRTDATTFGPYVRYIAALGNHDLASVGWFERWNRYLPGQRELGANAEDGIYFFLTIANTLFIVLDSSHPSDQQTAWLEAVLSGPEAASARFRFALFHDPIYPCDEKPPAAMLLPWVDIFERYALDVAFVSHSHTYERTCAMLGGHCAAGGVVYLDTGTVAAPPREVLPALSGTVVGETRTDNYDCREILQSYLGLTNQFCHLRIQGCRATARCYAFDAPETGADAFDNWVLDRC